jgi:hypothetical protein
MVACLARVRARIVPDRRDAIHGVLFGGVSLAGQDDLVVVSLQIEGTFFVAALGEFRVTWHDVFNHWLIAGCRVPHPMRKLARIKLRGIFQALTALARTARVSNIRQQRNSNPTCCRAAEFMDLEYGAS